MVKRFAVSIATLIIAASCTNQDSLFANSMVPPSQEMATLIDTSSVHRTTIFALDSVPTSVNAGTVFLGSIYNPTIGLTTAHSWSTYLPQAFEVPNSTFLFGKDPVFDSMYMLINFSAVKGDTSQKLRISVHEVKDTILRYYKTYYSNFVGTNYYDPTPLIEFDFSGGKQYLKKMLPRSYFDRLLFNDITNKEKNPYFTDSIFMEKFRGFYFKVEPITPPTKGAMYQIEMSSSTMRLHYHNSNEKPDTTSIGFQFYYGNRRAVSFYTAANQYDYADPSAGGVDYREIGDTTLNLSTCFVSGMSGLGTRVQIDTAHLEALRVKAKEAGYNHIALHRAQLRWYVSDHTPKTYDWIPLRLCLYYDFINRTTVPDYDPISEGLSQSYQSDIGGYINRSNGYYEQNITSTMQDLLNKVPDASSVVQLLPSTTQSLYYGYVSLGGAASEAALSPQLVLVYTLVR